MDLRFNPLAGMKYEVQMVTTYTIIMAFLQALVIKYGDLEISKWLFLFVLLWTVLDDITTRINYASMDVQIARWLTDLALYICARIVLSAFLPDKSVDPNLQIKEGLDFLTWIITLYFICFIIISLSRALILFYVMVLNSLILCFLSILASTFF